MRTYRTGSTYRANPRMPMLTTGSTDEYVKVGHIPASHTGLNGPSGVAIGYFEREDKHPVTQPYLLARAHTEIVNNIKREMELAYKSMYIASKNVITRELFQPVYDDTDEYDDGNPLPPTDPIISARLSAIGGYILPSIFSIIDRYYPFNPFLAVDLLVYLCNIFEVATGHMPRDRCIQRTIIALNASWRYYIDHFATGATKTPRAYLKNGTADYVTARIGLEEVLLPWLHVDSIPPPTEHDVAEVTNKGRNLMDVLGIPLPAVKEMSPAEAEEAAARLAAAEQERATAAANLRHMLDLLDDLAVIPPK